MKPRIQHTEPLSTQDRTLRERVMEDVLRDSTALRSIPAGGIPLRAVANVPIASALPQVSGVRSGDEIVYRAGSGLWRFVYDPGGDASLPWAFVGGSPLRGERTVTGETYNAAGFGDPTTPGPLLTAPLAGEYRVGLHWVAAHSIATAFGVAAVKIGAAAAVDTDGVLGQNGAANTNWSSTTRLNLTVPAAGTVLKVQYRSGSGATMTLGNTVTGPIWLEAVPVRVS